MKKRYMLIALFTFCISLGGAYFLAKNQEQEIPLEDREDKEILQVSNAEICMEEDGKMVYQYYYTKDKITKESVEPVANYLVGFNRQQLQSVYNEWQIVFFSPDKVILRCAIQGKSSEVYMLGELDGMVAIFYEDENKKIKLQEKTDILVHLLPDYEKIQLKEGIYILGEENLVKLLGDLDT